MLSASECVWRDSLTCPLQVMSSADELLKCAGALSRLDVALSLGLLAQERVRSGSKGEE